jgi:hypothetical protein
MKKIMAGLAIGFFVLITLPAFAGFQVYQSTTSLGVVNKVKCSTGLTCSKVGDALQIVSNNVGVLQSQVSKVLSGSITVALCGDTIYGSGAIQLDLPTVSGSLGCRYTFVNASNGNLDINPQSGDRIEILTNTQGDMIRNATRGASITLEAVPVLNASGAYIWSTIGSQGTWSDAN